MTEATLTTYLPEIKCQVRAEVRGDTVCILRVRHSAQALLEPDEL